jgi:sugar lactone lactonase YvrE
MGAVQLVDANGVQATTNLRAVGQGSLGVFQPGVASVINVGTPGGLALSCPSGLAMDGTGNVYIADECNARVVEVPAAGVAKVFSTGSLTLGTNPQGVAVDGAGNVYIADTSANRVVEVTAAGAVSVLNTGNLTLSQPSGVAVDGAGNVYISDEFNNRVVELWTMGVASVLNTASLPGTTDGENNDDCNTTGLCEPHGLAVDSGGDVFIADTDNNRVVEVTAAGVASVLSTGSLTLDNPYDVVVDGAGDVYITDGGVVEVTPAGVASVLSTGNPGGTPMAAPWGIVVNGAGDLYLTDWANGLLVEVNQAQQSLSFAATPVGQTSMDSPQNVTVQNIGNQPLVFAAVATATTGQTLNSFNLNGSATTCTGSTSLTAGESCGLGVEFVPLTAGLLAGTVNILDNSLNAIFPNNMQQISLSGFVIAATTTSLSAPSNSTVGASVTLTATVLAGTTPVTTGTVTFLNGTTSIGTGAVNGSGVATLSLTTLPLGADSITASFAATTSDAASTSGASVVTVGTVSTTPDFTFTAASTEVSAKSGSAAVFTFTFTPANPATTFPFAVSLTASGLPTGATAVFSPAGIAAGAGTTKDTLTIQLPQAAAAAHSAIDLCRTLAPFSLALVLLPFAGSWRKGGRRLSRMISVSLLLFLGVVAAASVSGCGASSSKPQAYTVTVTGTSNNLSSSTTVTLTVD